MAPPKLVAIEHSDYFDGKPDPKKNERSDNAKHDRD